ncbi:(2Fe-2S)-binding protein [Natronococcus pandeyae]|uniref:(2Fe-2S)-binding protein n=1 Tax=Natronococcus pandeyae TaxID=2055836 RepID=A0A8J8Q6Q1_9EURY|nr:Rieske 2Fe-2S domain-containing protein [Natronococcus pandeyae]TYL39618.1 (2Fe-2S)-binding protein [Natronococcus pandeyae]
MAVRHRLTSVEAVHEEGSWLFTVRDRHGANEEVILVPCTEDEGEPVEAWINRCTHEDQRLHREGVGAVIRDGQLVCPKHGSMFETCSGYCDNGEAADTTLVSVDIDVEDGSVYLTDDDVTFLSAGSSGDDEDDDTPGSTSHIQF